MKKISFIISIFACVMFFTGCGKEIVVPANNSEQQLQQPVEELQKVNNEDIIYTLDDDMIKKMAMDTLEKYIELSAYENSNIGPMPGLLVRLGLENSENIELLCGGIYNASAYIKSNTKYEDFKNALLQYVTEDYFLNNFSNYKNIDDYVAFCNCAGGFCIDKIEKIELISKESDKYVFDVTFKCDDYEDDVIFENKEISFKYLGNKLVISEF